MSETVGADALATSAGRMRCPCCGASWCRCRECRARYVFGEAVACAMPVHGSAVPLACRCGAIVDGLAVVRTPRGRLLALVCERETPPRGLIARLRAQDRARERLESLVGAARRVARGGPRRRPSTAA
jgi:hypothetical protein